MFRGIFSSAKLDHLAEEHKENMYRRRSSRTQGTTADNSHFSEDALSVSVPKNYFTSTMFILRESIFKNLESKTI